MEDTGARTSGGLDLTQYDQSQIPIAVTRGPRHVLTYMNPAYRETFDDPPLLPIDEVFPELRERDRMDYFQMVYRTGVPEKTDAVPISRGRPEGKPWFVTYRIFPVTLPDGERGVLIVIVDLTEQFSDQQRLAEVSEERRRLLRRYESLVTSASQKVWVADPQGMVIDRSAGWAEATGLSWEEFRGEGWLSCCHPEDREELRSAWQRAVHEEPEVFEHVFRLGQRDGGYRHSRLHATPVCEAGTVVEWVSICTDIEESWREQRRQNLLAEATVALADTHRAEDAFAALARVIVPALADSCAIYLLPEAAEAAPGAAPPRGRPLLARRITSTAREGLPPDRPPQQQVRVPPNTAFARAVLERQSQHASFPPGEVPPDFAPPGSHSWLNAARAHAGVLVPVLIEGSVVAVVSAFTTARRQPQDEAERGLLRELLEQAHRPLMRTLEFQRTQRVAWALQHSLLTTPPRVRGLELAARYVPSPAAAEVGGDWYDAFVLPDGDTALVIGDVTGHNIDAAVTMSKLRNMLRGLAADRREFPGELLRRLDAAAQTMIPDEPNLATCVYATVRGTGASDAADGSPWTLRYSVAGHLPPLLIDADGTGRFLEDAQFLLLGGLDPDVPRSSATVPLPVGSTLLLYTDGLVERRGENLDDSLTHLCQQAASLARSPLERFCDRLVDEAHGTESDDMALIALRVPE